MATNNRGEDERKLELEFKLATLRSHELQMMHVYGLRRMLLGIAALAIIIGAIMTFAGLQGSFNWAVEFPNSIGAKMTNASPGILFATVGLILGFVVAIQKPVTYSSIIKKLLPGGGGSTEEHILYHTIPEDRKRPSK
ncbi:hypothetical protein OH773_21925 (plasmid) [Buttiauxella sp. WJP83]|uniref:hypothetical protein n=1 Tax=Buttiauxella sp. WJP83 TaxID=2986951 RepID=UPI0022DE6F0B|nr:hypothetical protein [Buttiauxella sp. WJP83]WBM73023.1 hypothetical protein OH773_21925 [Buttiauxella sp. WJP83]